ncbi:MAG: aminoacyl-tRNA hydrolase [Clostridiales bacterium]|nr:MAG: aminoacyl-tRNA hydrolase [Clostridiales bacterium]HJA30377.1 aminoacyl-tRNA hydrolase [Candidatus Eisenbergiella pullicola]
MYVIAGLGNPKKEYENTRHNVGFAAVDLLAQRHGIRVNEARHRGLVGKGMICGQKAILLKPLTYMNLSGESIRDVIQYYKLDVSGELIVLCDDINLDPGVLRVRKKGSAGGHNGLKNIIAQLGRDDFCRVRIGVGGKPEGYDLADYVLGHFGRAEKPVMDEAIGRACDAVETILSDGPDAAMNRFNAKP